MDSICLKAGIQAMLPPGGGGGLDARQHKKLSWGFSFPYPLIRSLWNGGKNKFDSVAVDDVVLADDKMEGKGGGEVEGQNGNWVFKILQVRSLWKGGNRGEDRLLDQENGNNEEEESEDGFCEVDGECEGCRIHDENEEKIEFDRESFSRLLKRVSLDEARLYAQMSFLGDLAYSIPNIKPENLLTKHGLHYVSSSFEKKEQTITAEKGKISVGEEGHEGNRTDQADNNVGKNEENKFCASAAYEIVASAASYLQTHTKSILPFTSSKSTRMSISTEEMASLMATTDSVTSVVSAKEEVKQAVADDLNSTRSSPCEWFICDEDKGATRYFVIKGSDSLESWQANLLFEPTKFEGLDVMVHRGIYEAAKGIYEEMLPKVQAYLKVHGNRATFRFTGHSLGGSLSILLNLMLLIRGEVPAPSLLPVITFGAPAVMCGGDYLLHKLGLPRGHLQSITMHRDIVPRAFSCNYPNHVAEFLKAVNRNFRNHPCLNKQKLLYAPMGEFLILQPDDKISPHHELLPSGSGLYLLSYPVEDVKEAEKQIRAAQNVFLNSPHPLEILSQRSSYGSSGSIKRDHDMSSYLKSIHNVFRQELNRIRKVKREKRRKLWWPLVAPRGVNSSIIVGRPVLSGNINQGQFSFYVTLQNGKESFKRFSRLVASQHMQLLVVLLFPAKLLILGGHISLSSFLP